MILSTVTANTVHAEQATIATASNFAPAMKALVTAFEKHTHHTVKTVLGSTGKLYAQINNGAPYDLLLAADKQRPAKLAEQANRSLPATKPFIYALGRIALWAPTTPNETAIRHNSDDYHCLATANPRLAPYGQAAQDFLAAQQLVIQRRITGENIGQTYQFVASGSCEAGIVALSQLLASHIAADQYRLIPTDQHQPIEQHGLLLRDNPAARAFTRYITSTEGRTIIRRFGYLLPEPQSK